MSRDYRILNTVTKDQTYCFCKPRPGGAYVPIYRMTNGESLAGKYPRDQYSVEMSLDDDWPGLKLPSIVGNAGSLIILQKDVARFFQDSFSLGTVETFAFTLLNHKGRIHSKDYVFFSPLGTHDCLDLDRSEVTRHTDGSLKSVARMVLDRQKLVDAPDLFRIRETPGEVLVSVEVINTLTSREYTNFLFTDVDHNGG